MSVVRLRERARRDLVDAIAYLAERSEQAARQFRIDAAATFRRLARSPGIGSSYDSDDPARARLRCSLVSRASKYIVFYQAISGGIEVVRVLHGARDVDNVLADEWDEGTDEAEELGG